jgi:Tol biopolymer transport system component/tRNA A-37 threonylcarbamoyl transferase component Bud32
MGLTPGARLGAFEIAGILGRGGMGEVYRARDTALGREVAIKILPEAFAADPDRSARFALEARVLASLNHPNIGAIYGLEERDGIRALVLELVEGPTLADRIAQCAAASGTAAADARVSGLPLDEVLSIAGQIAAALEAAHEQAVIHRDLKPANVKLRPDGTVKVLDFGLAKLAASGLLAAGAASTQSPTMTSPALMTQHGVILGTAGYMSPEQARGRVADKRSDVWSFGCVLYEMLTGRRAFPGEELADTLAAIVRAEPDWSALPRETPAPMRRLLERSLRKDPRERLPEIGSARLEIADARTAAAEPAPEVGGRHVAVDGPRRYIVPMLLTAIMAALLGATAMKVLVRPPTPAREIRLEIATPPTTDPVSFALSPDRRSVVYVAAGEGHAQLWLRSLDTGEQRPLRGTEGGSYPFWSPDSRSIGFFANGTLQRSDLDGDVVRALALAPVGAGGAWNADGVIVFAPIGDLPLARIPAAGGDVAELPIEPSQRVGQRFPQFLPDGESFVYYVINPAARGVYLGTLDGTERTLLIEADSAAVYANGELLYSRGGTLYAQRFDAAAGRLLGTAHALAEGLAVDPRGVPALSASHDGTIAFRTGSGNKERRLTWVDRAGEQAGSPHPPDPEISRSLSLSPDGRRVVMSRLVEGNTDIWLYELERRVFTRLTFDSATELSPNWSPDGKRVLYSRASESGFLTYEKSVDDPSGERPATPPGSPSAWVSDWSAAGWLLASTAGRGLREPDYRRSADTIAIPMDGGELIRLAHTDFDERSGQFSPDGRWVSYTSNESGRYEVFVQRFAENGRRLQVSSGGGMQPQWRPDGRELFYLAPDRRLMAVSLRAAPDGESLDVEAPVELFVAPVAATLEGGMNMEYVVSPDGQRFLLNALVEQSSPPLQVLLNREPVAE